MNSKKGNASVMILGAVVLILAIGMVYFYFQNQKFQKDTPQPIQDTTAKQNSLIKCLSDSENKTVFTSYPGECASGRTKYYSGKDECGCEKPFICK